MKKLYKYMLLGICMSFCVTQLLGQKEVKPYFSFDRISTENIKIEKGLSQNTVYTILQDNKGYMWFGTWDGLNKYDGYDFTVYRPVGADSIGKLNDETIYTLYEDVEGNLWIGTEKGVNKFNSKNQFFSRLSTNNKRGQLEDTINLIVGNKQGTIWIATNNGVYQYNESKGKITHYCHQNNEINSLANNHVHALLLENDQFLWIGTEGGLDKLDIQTNSINHYSTTTSPGLLGDTIFDMTFGEDYDLWIATSNGLSKLNRENNTITNFQKGENSIKHNDVRDVLFDSQNRLWIGTFGGGLSLYLNEENKFYTYNYNTTERKTIGSNYIYSLYEDDGGLIWIGTRKGVSKIDLNSYKFNHFYHHSNTNRSLNSDIIWGFAEDKDDNLWIATDNGINIYNKKSKRYKYIRNDPKNDNSLICNDTRCFYFDDSGYLWIGTNCRGLEKYNLNTQKFIHYNKGNSNLSSNEIWDIKEDYRGHLWIATSNGLNMFSANRDTIVVFKKRQSRLKNSLVHNLVYSILPDSNSLWIATIGGLSNLDINTLKFKTFQSDKIGNSLSTDKLFSVFKDADGIYWIGTINGGLNSYNPKTGLFENYTMKDGLANNVVYNIMEDRKGNLWMSTNYGLSKFSKKNKVFVNYDVRDGLQSNEFNFGAAYKSSSGEMYFGGMNGYNTFYPDQVKKNSFMPKIIITSFEIMNKQIPLEYEDGDSIILDYRNNFFTFEFAGLDFSKPNKIRYAYKLENFNKNWIYTNASKRFAEYTDINPGNYIFRVKCTNSDGIMNKGISVFIRIKPPWWKTYSFWIPFSLFFLFAISNIFYFRIQRIRQKNELQAKMLSIEKQLFELEQKALRLQMNPHFIFNSLNSIQSFILANNRDKAVRYLSKFAKLMRLILYNTKESFINFGDELKAINYYLELEKLRFDSKFDYKISIDKAIDVDFISIPPMLIQPYIENAILHGVINKPEEGFVEINFIQQQDSIQCIITDNGIGRARSAELKAQSGLQHKSRSMAITKERLDIMNKQRKGKANVNIIDLFDGDFAAGTKVIIDIPFKC